MLRVIVAGSRHLADYALVKAKLDQLLARHLPDVVILSGAARGADALGERYAAEAGLACERFPADWSKGKRAGPERNRRMAVEGKADALVLFDGGGPGSASMRQIAEGLGLKVRVVKVEVSRDDA